ncbi:hypothetical protein K491DRAFT_710077 [Lophiostoma macrostomum CBS 122681]|uniref:Peptidase S33 tripeptidyl aminopeptidase-like C-terminal domain-containing protein n=1 Tax=Lophiostoma macrostomum CBS 122681 TaxID=1314788 RepID=A0A6A6TQN8_9PLEO|nr:hypothetical protein K491DRAFT_710077 [Lophiostoma macrostomum CBS 122681]
MRYPKATALSAIALSTTTLATPVHKRANVSMIYDFASLDPTPEFNWTPCFDTFTCTLLEVPLDYDDTSAGTTGIAFIKWSTNATNSSSPPQDILTNPGGPGGSGVTFLISALELLTEAFGTDNNIVSFDPRGVNNSGPDVSCFPGVKNTAQLYGRGWGSAVDVNSTSSIATAWAQAGAFGDWCTAAHSGANDTAKYANTIATAQDMLHYTEVLAASNGEDKDSSELWYYGASYGTVLGSTFASLFPDRVGRIILDGVVDGEDYYQGKWEANLFDADAAVKSFFTYCYEGGSSSCAFWDESPEAIEDRWNNVLAKLEAEPITVINTTVVSTPTIVTITDFKNVLLQVPYSPSVYFPILANVLAELEQGNGDGLALYSGEGASLQCSDSSPLVYNEIEPRFFIACNDANGRFNLSTVEDFTENADYLYNQSHLLGEAWAAATAVICRKLDIKAPQNQIFTGVPSANETSHPILFIGNTVDPVTPLRGAKKMSSKFGGSRVLTQDSVGHTSEAAVSKCTFKYVQQYFADASLPDEGTVCEADEVPFQASSSAFNTKARREIRKLKKRHHI